MPVAGPRRSQGVHADTQDSGVSGLYTQRTGSMCSSHQIFDSPGSLYINPVAPAAAPSVPDDGSALLDEEGDGWVNEAQCSAVINEAANDVDFGETGDSSGVAAEDDRSDGNEPGGDPEELDVLEQEPSWIVEAPPTASRGRRLSI